MKTIYLILFWSSLSMVSFNHVLAQSIPTKIFLDKETVEDGTPANTPIATISTDLPHLDDTFIFEVLPYLNDPEEYPDYEYFKIIGRTLYTAKEIFSPAWDWPDFFFIIRVTNSEDESFSAEFIIVIEYVNVAPKITELSSNTVPEKLEFDFLNPAFTIGEIVVTDPNPDDKHVVTIVDDGPESALFTVVKSIDPGTLAETFLLQTSHTFIYAEKNQYTLQFIACETGTEGLCSEPTSFDIFITTNEPQPPTGIIASTLSANSISLSWTNPAGNLQEIEIERSLLADEDFLLIHSTGDQSESWVDENLEAGTTYYYRLRSKIDDAFSDFSIVVSATTEEEPVIIPDPVQNLTATALSPFAIELQWNPLSEADQIILQRSLTGDENDFTDLATLDGNASSYSDTELTPATEYFYRARVILNGQESEFSETVSATTEEEPVIIPDPVQNLTATALSPFAIELQWNPLSEADQIILQRSLTGDENDFTDLATLDGNASTYSDTELTPATEYFYRARVILNGQESEFSETVSATTEEEPVIIPDPVQNLTATALSPFAIELQWNPLSEADQIILQRSLTGDENDFTDLATLDGNASSYSDTELTPATEYFYRARVILNGQESEFSETVSATTEEEPTVIPDPVQNLTATALSPFAIELQWNPLSEADQIILQRSLTGDENDFTDLATLDGNASSYSDTELTPATEYFYRARVILNGQESVYSGLAAATTLEDIEMVTIEGRILNPLGQPVKEVEIEVEGSASLQTMTDVNGRFQFDFPNNAPFRVIPSKSQEARPNNGISTLDIILVGRHILNLRPINDPFLILAADVNKDNNITAIDQMMMRNVLLGKTNAFVNQQLWRFMPASHNLAESMIFSHFIEDVAENGKNIDFTGIRLGDVNYSWNINAARTGFTGTLAFELREPEFTEREIFIPVYAENFSAIAGFQFTLDWNPSELQILAVKNAALNVHFHKPDNQSGIMSISFDEPGLSGRSLSDKDILFYLSVQKKSNANLNISSLQISTSLTEVMALDAELNLLNIELKHKFQSQPEPTGYALLQNHPNPVQDISHFVFEAAEEGLATVTIMDGIGRIVDRIEQKASKGYNSITWNKEKITLAIKPGVYLYKLEINDFQAVRRMSIR